MNLLIVDDEPLEREVLMDVVKKNHIGITHCLEAVNGASALEIVTSESIDIVVMDIKMPVMDGITAAKVMKERSPHLKVLFLTAYNEFDYALQTIKLGVVDYLLKPVRPDEFIQALKKVTGPTKDQTSEEIHQHQSNNIIETITTFIHDHVEEKLTLVQLSEVVHLHPQYVSRLFKQEMGMTLTDYITVRRIEKAKELLANSKKTIADISEQCGFTDPNYFTRVFKKLEGCPPKQYRENEQQLKREKVNRQYFNKIM